MRYRFIHAERATYPLWLLCKVLGVSRKGYYSWLKRGEADPDYRELDQAIRRIHRENARRYGTRRVKAVLEDDGVRAGRRLIRRRMRHLGLKVRYPKAFRVTTNADPNADYAPNILARRFDQDGPNEVWVGDISYVRTCSGFLYLAFVVDLFSRMVVGWSVQPHMRAELVDDALRMALGRRDIKPGLVFHSDRGSQYTSDKFHKTCEEFGIVQSMSRKGDCWDNAVAESFLSAIDRELLSDGRSWSPERSKLEIFSYIETYYNRKRLHSTLGYKSPWGFESKARQINELSQAA